MFDKKMKTFAKLVPKSVLWTNAFGSSLFSELEKPTGGFLSLGRIVGKIPSQIGSFVGSSLEGLENSLDKILQSNTPEDDKKKEENHNGQKSEVNQNQGQTAAARPAAPLSSGVSESTPAGGPASQNPPQPGVAYPAVTASGGAAVGSVRVPEPVYQNPPQPAAGYPVVPASGGAVSAGSGSMQTQYYQ